MQLEPRPPQKMHNDGLLVCDVERSMMMYPQFKGYFDVILDFGVLEWGPVDNEVEVYFLNIVALLKTRGLYVLKIDDSARYKFNMSEIGNYFVRAPFGGYEDEVRVGSKEKDAATFHFFRTLF